MCSEQRPDRLGSDDRAVCIDGKAEAARLNAQSQMRAATLKSPPSLVAILVGDDPASRIYVRNKIRKAAEVGVEARAEYLPATAEQAVVSATIRALSDDPDVDGILLQLPLPTGLNAAAALAHLDPEKDVDGLTALSAGYLASGQKGLRPCTPRGCVLLAKSALGDDLGGAHCVVLGRSVLVGRPAAAMFLAEDCTVTSAHSKTRHVDRICAEADILVCAVGRPQLVGADWVKHGACVIDVGINRVGDSKTGRLVGDVDHETVSRKAGALTPVPGGVGPMTIACLLDNTVRAACERRGTAPSLSLH